MSEDLMESLRRVDPLLTRPADDSPERLATVYRRVVATDSAARPATGRRWLVMGGVAASLALVLTGGAALIGPGGQPGGSVTAVALAADGTLSCGSDYVGSGGPIDPADAPVRYLPRYLPEGWRLGDIRASTRTTGNCYASPSLTAVTRQGDGLVTRSAMVYGPIRPEITFEGIATPATIAGMPGQVILREGPKGPSELYWVWTDAAGSHWLMRTYGHSLASGERLAAALSVSDDLVDLDTAAAPADTQIVHRRTGAPYPEWDSYLQWDVTLEHGSDRVYLGLTSRTDAAFGMDGIFPGEYLVTQEDGRLAVEQYAYGGMNLYEPQSGPSIYFGMDPDSGGEPSLGAMDPADWEKVVKSLVDVPADDPRLTGQG